MTIREPRGETGTSRISDTELDRKLASYEDEQQVFGPGGANTQDDLTRGTAVELDDPAPIGWQDRFPITTMPIEPVKDYAKDTGVVATGMNLAGMGPTTIAGLALVGWGLWEALNG